MTIMGWNAPSDRAKGGELPETEDRGERLDDSRRVQDLFEFTFDRKGEDLLIVTMWCDELMCVCGAASVLVRIKHPHPALFA